MTRKADALKPAPRVLDSVDDADHTINVLRADVFRLDEAHAEIVRLPAILEPLAYLTACVNHVQSELNCTACPLDAVHGNRLFDCVALICERHCVVVEINPPLPREDINNAFGKTLNTCNYCINWNHGCNVSQVWINPRHDVSNCFIYEKILRRNIQQADVLHLLSHVQALRR